MILNVQRQVQHQLTEAVRRQYGIEGMPPFAIEVPPNRALGDLAVTAAFQLARTLRKSPRVIAQELAAAIGAIPGIARLVAAPNGYLNLYLDRPAFLLARLRGDIAPLRSREEKTIVEHTAINPNKAAHIGHLRNATLGDTLARVLRFRETPVEVQNYIDDTGVQVADVIVGFREIEHRTLDDVRRIAETTRFDYYCWDLYSRVTEWYESDRARLAIRAAALQDLEHGGNDTAAIGTVIVERIVRAHLKTMARLNIEYDLLTYEGDILRLHFWTAAFDILRAKDAVFLQDKGRLKGCWVMRIEEEDEGSPPTADIAAVSTGDAASGLAGAAEDVDVPDAREKVIVRSNGVVTYVGKDIANQFWKFGLLGRDFRYLLIGQQASGRPLWATTSHQGDAAAPAFGHASRIYNVIDSRQMYLQALLSQALRVLGHAREAERSIHFSYEMVALSQSTAKELGYEAALRTDESAKPFVEVSGRKGLGVKIDDLLDLLMEKASAEVVKRNPEFSPDECRYAATQIAVAAIRYFMLKFSRGKLIVFDIEEALSFEGETGPYLQYAVVRANNIFLKLQEREGLTETDVVGALDPRSADELMGEPTARGDGSIEHMAEPTDEDSALWALVFEASRLDEIVEQVVQSLEFSALAKYAFGLAQMFNAFYHRYPILKEERANRKLWRAAGVAYFRGQLACALDLMGIEVPSRM